MGSSESEGEKYDFNFAESSLESFIYQVWKERNGRLHGKTERTNLQVLEAIKDVTRIRLAGVKSDTATNLGRQLRNSLLDFLNCN